MPLIYGLYALNGEAEKEIREAIKITPQFAGYHWTYGEILEAKNDIPGAIKLVEEYKNLGGDATKATKRLARLRAKL